MTGANAARSTGVNASEAYLGRLARHTFLSLWSHQNLYRDVAKELADLVVLCGNIAIVFSDKRVKFQEDIPLEQAWQRWYNRAVLSSVKQLNRASGWLHRHPDRIFRDPQCTHRVQDFDFEEELEVFCVAVANGAAEACVRHFEHGSGSLIVSPHEDSSSPAPFSVGNPNKGRGFVHVFDEAHLHIILQELDTVTDFVEYLRGRERLISNGMLVFSASEEDLLAAYITEVNEKGEHDWAIESGKSLRIGQFIAIKEGGYRGMRERPEYHRKKLADRKSYVWDRLIERFAENLRKETMAPIPASLGAIDGSDGGAEKALRLMALERRLARRNYVEAMQGSFERLESHGGDRFFRAMLDAKGVKETGFCFMLLKRSAFPDDVTYEEYREFRASMLATYVEGIAERHRNLKQIVGIATEGDISGGSSEDLLLFQPGEWNDEAISNLRERESGFDIFRSELNFQRFGTDEYPDELPIGPSSYSPIPYEFHAPSKPKSTRKLGGNRRERRAAAARARKQR